MTKNEHSIFPSNICKKKGFKVRTHKNFSYSINCRFQFYSSTLLKRVNWLQRVFCKCSARENRVSVFGPFRINGLLCAKKFLHINNLRKRIWKNRKNRCIMSAHEFHQIFLKDMKENICQTVINFFKLKFKSNRLFSKI